MRIEEEKEGECLALYLELNKHPIKDSTWLIIIMTIADFLIDLLLGSLVPVFCCCLLSPNRLPLDGIEAHTGTQLPLGSHPRWFWRLDFSPKHPSITSRSP